MEQMDVTSTVRVAAASATQLTVDAATRVGIYGGVGSDVYPGSNSPTDTNLRIGVKLKVLKN